jgi:hypothetical protein
MLFWFGVYTGIGLALLLLSWTFEDWNKDREEKWGGWESLGIVLAMLTLWPLLVLVTQCKKLSDSSGWWRRR